MIGIHLMLVCRRLQMNEKNTDKSTKLLFKTVLEDMKHNLREIGVGDMGVVRHIKRMPGVFYGRSTDYDKGSDGDGDLAEILANNLYRLSKPWEWS